MTANSGLQTVRQTTPRPGTMLGVRRGYPADGKKGLPVTDCTGSPVTRTTGRADPRDAGHSRPSTRTAASGCRETGPPPWPGRADPSRASPARRMARELSADSHTGTGAEAMTFTELKRIAVAVLAGVVLLAELAQIRRDISEGYYVPVPPYLPLDDEISEWGQS